LVNGQAVAKTLPPRIPNEIFVFGSVYVQAPPERYLKFATDLNRLRKLSQYVAVGSFSKPPKLSDLEGFTLDHDDIMALKDCKPGDCDLQMPASRMEPLRQSFNWSAPNVDEIVNRSLQETALERLAAYKQGGNQILGQYNDKKHPTQVADQFKYMLSYHTVLPKILPDFYNYLLDYPKNKPQNVTSQFTWEKVKFGLKPTLRVIQVLVMHGTTPETPAYVIAQKQLYSSHYFETALDLSYVIRSSDDPQKPGFYLIQVMGSEQSGLTGFKGSIIRRVAVDRSVTSLQKSLAAIKATMESNP
ncbi:MAG: hypothetical protein U0V70_22380, partial [Terriglobia bacterium]